MASSDHLLTPIIGSMFKCYLLHYY